MNPNTPLRIVFMGTPQFAVGIAEAIHSSPHQLCGIVTVPDKPAGRGQKITSSAVKAFALKHQIPLLQPDRLKDSAFISSLQTWQADVFVVVAFRMLPAVVWQIPPLGTFNLHASLLPDYRGAAPIQWAIMRGETRTGVSTFFIDEHIDTGAVILQRSCPIGPDMTASELHDQLMELGKSAVLDTLTAIQQGKAQSTAQPDPRPNTSAPKLQREHAKINWNQNGQNVYNQIRGLSKHPGAWMLWHTEERAWEVKILGATWDAKSQSKPIKPQLQINNHGIKVPLEGGDLWIQTLQWPGKRSMSATEFTHGYKGPEWVDIG